MKKKITVIVICLIISHSVINIQNCNSQWAQTYILNSRNIYSLSFSSATIFAGTYNGVYISTNYGSNWNSSSLNNLTVCNINVNGINIYAGTTDGIFKSTNMGINWVQFAFYVTVPVIATFGTNIFVGTDYEGVYRSTNSGTNWFHTPLNNKSIKTFFVAANNIVYAGTVGYGIYYTTNLGTNWTQTSLNNKTVYSQVILSNYFFAGVDSSGILMSTNSGSTWTQTSLNNCNVNSIINNGNYLFAGTSKGIFMSTNFGTTWIQKNQGFNSTPIINSMALGLNYIFAGADDGKIWRRWYGEIIGIKNISSEIPDKFMLYQNYPNPFNPSTNIRYQIANNRPQQVILTVFNNLGKEIATLVNEKQSPGTYEVSFDGSNLASGIYFYTLTVGNEQIAVKKMTLLK